MFGCYLLQTYSLLLRDRKGTDPQESGGGEELREIEGRETAIKIYKKRIYFQ